jgi:hypothetical protein
MVRKLDIDGDARADLGGHDGTEPWQGDRRYVNNLALEEAADAAAIYGPERFERLVAIKKAYDLANMVRLSHNVMPASD